MYTLLLGPVMVLLSIYSNIVIVVLLRLDDDRPAWRESRVMDVEVIGFERIAGEDRRNGQSLAIWQVHRRRRHYCEGIPMYSMIL